MKKLLLIFFVLCFSVSYSQTLLLNENFDYGATANSDITLTTQNWARHSGAQGPQYLTTSLTYTGYPSSNVGGAISFTYGSSSVNDGDVNRTLSSSVTTTSNVYASFLVNFTSAKTSSTGAGDYFFHLGPTIISTTFRGRVFCNLSGTDKWVIGLTKSSETPVTYSSTVLSLNHTYLVVLKFSFNTTAADDDLVTLYVYDSNTPTSEPGSPLATVGPVGAGTTNDLTDIGAVAIRQSSNCPTGTIDGIRVSDNWGLAVTGVATGVEEDNSTLPTKFNLSQNYPNPFNPSTVIKYQVPQNSFVNINVYDVLGNQVRTLVREEKAAGSYDVKFDASNMPSGVYFYSIQAGAFTQTKKMILMK